VPQARFPFLDEDVVAALLGLPLWEIVDLQQPIGFGDKKILRQVAISLGLTGAASLPKRAIQVLELKIYAFTYQIYSLVSVLLSVIQLVVVMRSSLGFKL
jgi:asparagine synthetase B (glutamine-hydrolysing)